MELNNGDRPTSVGSVSFVLFQGSELVDLQDQRLANVKVDLMSIKVGHHIAKPSPQRDFYQETTQLPRRTGQS